MTKIEEEIRLELEHSTNRCRMELVSIQTQYYVLIIQKLFLENLKRHENIELYSKNELLDMLKTLENIIYELESESTVDGMQKYTMSNSSPFIDEALKRVMDRYGFSGWNIH